MHALVVEIADLAETGRQPLAAAVAFEQPRGDRQGGLVGVHLPVGAGEAVAAEQLAEAEGELLGVEQRQVVLVSIGHAQVVQARLQGLQHRPAEQPGGALEDQASVEAGDRRAALGAAVGETTFDEAAFQRIAGLPPGQLRAQVAPGALQRQRQPGRQIVAAAGRAVVVVEQHRLGGKADAQPVGQRAVVAEHRARQAAERLGAVGDGRVGDVPVVREDAGGPVVATAAQADAAFDQAGAGAEQGVAEILEITVVGDVLDVGQQPPVRAEHALVTPAEVAAVAVGEIVVGQPVAFELAAMAFAQVAELRAQHHAATAQHAGVEGGIVVRREVEVIRHAQVNAALVVVAEAGIQEAAATALVDGEAGVGQPQHRHPAQPQGGVAHAAHARLAVQVHGLRAQRPTAPAGIAGAVVHRLQIAARPDELGAVGLAVAAQGDQLVAQRLHATAVGGKIAGDAGGGYGDRSVLVAHVAFGTVGGGGVGVVETVGAQVLVGAAQVDIAGQPVHILAADIEMIGFQVGRRGGARPRSLRCRVEPVEQRPATTQRPGVGLRRQRLGGSHRRQQQRGQASHRSGTGGTDCATHRVPRAAPAARTSRQACRKACATAIRAWGRRAGDPVPGLSDRT